MAGTVQASTMNTLLIFIIAAIVMLFAIALLYVR